MTEYNTQMTAEVPHEKVVNAAKMFLIRQGYELSSNKSSFDAVAWKPDEKEIHFVNVYAVDEWPEGVLTTRQEFEQKMSDFIISNVEDINRLDGDFHIVYDECVMRFANAERAILRFQYNCFGDGSDIK